MIEHGGHGAYTAPAVKEVMEEYFGYNTEINETIDMKAIDDILIR